MHCTCATQPYFHLQSKIWRHHRLSRPQFSLWRDNFGHSAINKGYIAYFYFACENRPYLCGLKSDVIIVFLNPDFLNDAKISAIRIHLRQKYDYLIFAWVFRTCWPKMGVLGKIGEKVVRYWPHNELVLPFGGSYVCANFGENRPKIATVRVLADGHTDRHTDRRKPIL